MSIRQRFLPTIALTSMLVLPLSAQAEDTADTNTVMATVNGTEITLGHMIALRASLPAQYGQLPAELLFNGILDQLVQQTLLMQDHTGDLSQRNTLILENERRGIVASEVIDRVMNADLSDEEIQAAYDRDYAGAEAETEYKAAHILVETEDEAKTVVQELADGADFAETAAEKSTGPSGPNSDPVQTQFGWHVIKLNETRVKDTPKLDDVRTEIEESLRQAAFDAHIETLTGKADIDRTDSSGIDPEIVNNLDLLEN